MMKKIVSVTLVCLMSFMLCACGDAAGVSMDTLQDKMLSADDSLPAMSIVNSDDDDAEDLFAYISDVDYSKIDSYFLAYSSDGKADEVVVVRVKKSNDVDAVKQSLEDHIQGRISLYKSYDTSQVNRAENAILFTNDNDVILIVSNNQDAIKQEYEDLNK